MYRRSSTHRYMQAGRSWVLSCMVVVNWEMVVNGFHIVFRSHRSTLCQLRCWQLLPKKWKSQVRRDHFLSVSLLMRVSVPTAPSGESMDEMRLLEEQARRIAEEATRDQPKKAAKMTFVKYESV